MPCVPKFLAFDLNTFCIMFLCSCTLKWMNTVNWSLRNKWQYVADRSLLDMKTRLYQTDQQKCLGLCNTRVNWDSDRCELNAAMFQSSNRELL